MSSLEGAFAHVIREHTDSHFVERRWLYRKIKDELDRGDGRHVLVTGEPGAGKTSLLAGLAKANPAWLRYFVRRDSQTAITATDTQSFLLEIGHQLARQHPELFQPERLKVVVRQQIDKVAKGGRAIGIRIEDLAVSPFLPTANLELEQRANHVAGDVIGVEIGTAHLEPRLLEPDVLAQLALIAPAESLLTTDRYAKIVILLDALDELTRNSGAGLLHWLATGPDLPPNVHIVMASRPHSDLGLLRAARTDRLSEVAVEAESPQTFSDLLSYAELTLSREPVTAAIAARGLIPDKVRHTVVQKAAGNFLYLAMYARALGDAIIDGDEPLVDQLVQVTGAPRTLNGLYGFFVETVRTELMQLGTIASRQPATSPVPVWEGIGRPVLGLLTVAREPISVEQLIAMGGIQVWPSEVRNALARLRWLLGVQDDRITFYHASLSEFLAAQQTRQQHPDCWVDTLEWHERIVGFYRSGHATWADVDWDAVDRYGLVHVAAHVTRCRAEIADEAADVFCPGLRRASRAVFGSDQHLVPLIDDLAEHVTARLPLATALSKTLYLGVVRRQISGATREMSPVVLGLLARMNGLNRALEHAYAMPLSLQRFEAFSEILEHAAPEDASLRRELIEHMIMAALTVPESEGGQHAKGKDLYPLAEAALKVAPYDLERALRLWPKRAKTKNYSGHDEADLPDPVYRAAADAAPSLQEACALIASMRNGRADAYLDFAARAEPYVAVGLLRQAEESISGAGFADRLRGLARLAAGWKAIDPGETKRCLDRIITISRTAASDAEEWANGLVGAAAHLVDIDRCLAMTLLESLEPIGVNGTVQGPLEQTAKVWAALGSADRATRWLHRLIDFNHTGYTKTRCARIFAEFDPRAARRLLNEVIDAVPAARSGAIMDRLNQDGDLQKAALELADTDLAKATEVARQITEAPWHWVMADRNSTLAQIAHRYLDAGDRTTAQRLLDELLGDAEMMPSLTGEPRIGPYERITTFEALTRVNESARALLDGRMTDTAQNVLERLFPAGPVVPPRLSRPSAARVQTWQEALEWYTYGLTLEGKWKQRSDRFYRSAADVVRTVMPLPTMAGNRFSWSRTVRALAEASMELGEAEMAADLILALEPTERVIGLAALLQWAYRMNAPELCDAVWGELVVNLGRIEAYDWLRDDGRDFKLGEQDETVLAYLRPDHYARFEVAVRIAPWHTSDGVMLLADGGALFLTFAHLMTAWAEESAAFVDAALDGQRLSSLYQMFKESHERVLDGNPSGGDTVLVDVLRTQVLIQQSRLADLMPNSARPPISSPLYATLIDLVTAKREQNSVGAFFDDVQDLIDSAPAPAVAGMLSHAADLFPEEAGVIRELGSDLIASLTDPKSWLRREALIELALSPQLRDLVDVPSLFQQVRGHVPGSLGEVRIGNGRSSGDALEAEAAIRLFPLILSEDCPAALQTLYAVLQDSWPIAMALIESGAKPIITAIGPDAVALLHDAVERALDCASLQPVRRTAIDGVDFEFVRQVREIRTS